MSFGKMATLLFGLAAVLAMASFVAMPRTAAQQPSETLRMTGRVVGDNPDHVVHNPVPPDEDAPLAVSDPGPAGVASVDAPVSAAAPVGDTSDRANPDHVTPATQRGEVSFVPGQPMVDPNPAR